MRTTLTLDPDVAAAIARRRRKRGTGLKEEVNALLRAGLAADDAPADDEYVLPTFDSGRQLLDWPEIEEQMLREDVDRALR